jgi:DNA repair protein RecO (recombination protein O)
MKQRTTVDAIVLQTVEYRDTSRIVYLYSKMGHANMIGKGVKQLHSPLRVMTQVGTMINVIWKGDERLHTLTEASLVEEYPNVHKDVLSFTWMSHILELVRLTIPKDANHEKMFAFLQRILFQMEQGVDAETLSLVFELKLLHFLGNGLHLKSCTVCNKTENLVFHPQSGGLICMDHSSGYDVYPEEIIKIISELYYIDVSKQPLPIISELNKALLRHILDEMYEDFVGVKTKSREIIRQLKQY